MLVTNDYPLLPTTQVTDYKGRRTTEVYPAIHALLITVSPTV